MGEISQLAGARRYELTDGKAKGVEAVDIRTGSGLEFTVLPGRGMDISRASFRSVPMSFMSKTGVVSPSYYECQGVGWLRNFFGGLLTTCGLSNTGAPSEKTMGILGKQDLGLHGRIANTCADNVCVQEKWENGTFTMTVSGRVSEAMTFGECLVLSREIRAVAGVNKIFLTDTIENLSPYESPAMLLYHINAGYPLLDEGTEFKAISAKVTGVNPYSEANASGYARMESPRAGSGELVYFHDLVPDSDDKVRVAIMNPMLEFGMYVAFDKKELPYFTQWKACEEQDYAMGLEPGNCQPMGYAAAKERGMVEMLPPFGQKKAHIEIGVLEDSDDMDAFCRALPRR